MADISRRALKTLVLLTSSVLYISGPSFAQSTDSAAAEQLRQPLAPQSVATPSPEKVKRDYWVAYRMAKNEYIDIAIANDPRLVAAICAHPGPAKLLAQHRHIDKIAQADHYLCRRLTRWRGATEKLIRNPKVDSVIALDPEGIYYAIENHPQVARLLARHTLFNQMIATNPDLGRKIAEHMR